MPTRRHSLLLLGATALSACVAAPAIVTRDASDPFEGGIGGTGIVGTLTGFGSLMVNGLRVELDDGTDYRTPFGRVDAGALVPGQMLTVSAERTADRTVARAVSVDYTLVGTQRMAGGRAHVNGVPLLGAAPTPGHSGARVAVSGAWAPGGVRPNRIDPAPDPRDLIAGTASRDPSGRLRIGGVPVEARGAFPGTGSFVAAYGRAEPGGFVADRLRSDRFRRLGSLGQLSVEGYLEPSPTAPGIRIAGLGHNFARDVDAAVIGSRRALYFGRYDGRFGAERGYLLPDPFARRAALLSDGLGEDFTGNVVGL